MGSLKREYDKIISDKFANEVVNLRKYVSVYASGGGTNATQYQDGGVMNGALQINGNLTVFGAISAANYLGITQGGGTANALPLSGGTLTGGLTGTNAVFQTISAANYLGINNSSITEQQLLSSFLPLSGGNLTGSLSSNSSATFQTLTANNGTFTGTVSAAQYLGLPADIDNYLPLSGGNLTGALSSNSGAVFQSLTATTVNSLTLSAQSVGFTISGGTTPKTLTIPLDARVSGTNTGDQTLGSLGAEAVANKTITLTNASTDVQYPSAKVVYDQLATKQATLVSNSNIKTVDGQTLLGMGDIPVQNIDWKSTYNTLSTYVVNDGVAYSGSSYICKLESTGNLPTNTTYWDVLARMGDPGVSGVSGAFTVPFTNSTSVSCNHNFAAFPVIQVIDNTNTVITPSSITHPDTNNSIVTLASPTSGNVICTIGGVSTSIVTKNSDYTVLPNDSMILVTATARITLPDPTGLQGRIFYIKHLANTGVSVIIDTATTAKIDGEDSWTMIAKYTSMTLLNDGSNYYIT